jgi:hypothetical protein
MKLHLYCAVALSFAAWLPAQDMRPDTAITRSVSGQFIIMKRARAIGSRQPNPGTNANLIRLEASLVSVSCERVKQALQKELEDSSAMKGKVYIWLTPAVGLQDEVEITSELFKDGWHYHVNLPDIVDRAQYVRAMAQVCLQSMAERKPDAPAVEMPLWLVEGFTRKLLSSSELAILLPPPAGVMSDSLGKGAIDIKYKPLEKAHFELVQHPALTFEELSWPRPMNTLGDQLAYDFSSELFVVELLRLQGGRVSLRHMVAALPNYYNWQLAFFQAFGAHFKRPRDVEKWWALQVVRFTGRDLDLTWSISESAAKLREAIHPSVQVRTGTNDVPLHLQVSLQTVLREWDGQKQKAAITNVFRQLENLQPRMARQTLSLSQSYQTVLQKYFAEGGNKFWALPLSSGRRGRDAATEAIKHLDLLDLQLADFNPQGTDVSAAQTILRAP